MNAALIHDRLHIKSFWEKRINNQCRHKETEEQRMKRSALQKLRGGWLVRLEERNKHLKNLNDGGVKTGRAAPCADQQ
ncbi:protein FAM240C [Brachionichthys hirsutus]|uniref:protein FAM240C n=1 Tax=Brachionichthys hirsutus TaxID=412623 RepID=UPI003604C02D